ncbi:MAG TPA: hypothetical protein VID75_05860 [Acidimicrobiales bacterium]|jgi:hypothetical protein
MRSGTGVEVHHGDMVHYRLLAEVGDARGSEDRRAAAEAARTARDTAPAGGDAGRSGTGAPDAASAGVVRLDRRRRPITAERQPRGPGGEDDGEETATGS